MKTYSIVIADTYPMMAEGEQAILRNLPEVEVVGICLQYEALFPTLQSIHCPDLILLDPQIGNMEGTKLCKKLQSLFTDCRIVVFGTENDPVLVKKYFQVGIKGYLLRNATSADLLQALRTVLSGDHFIDKKIEQFFFNLTLGFLKKKKNCSKLTKRECEVLHLIVEEYTAKEIAQRLFIGLCTVETHRQNLIQKLGVKNTAGLVRVALQNHLYQVALP